MGGKCACPKGYHGIACEFVSCPDDCSGGGECNRLSGKCICKMGFSGPRCRRATRCNGAKNSVKKMNWYTVWDKPGWITCPIGQAVYAFRRGLCDALSCLNSGSCAAPCEGTSADAYQVPIRHCYHSLDWYGSMDKQGWSKCEANYFVTGLYRSCDSRSSGSTSVTRRLTSWSRPRLWCARSLTASRTPISASSTAQDGCVRLRTSSFPVCTAARDTGSATLTRL